jgi:hypothetical protein
MSYQAIVTPLRNVRPHPNADRLKLATVCGMQVIVGLDAVDGTMGVFFSDDGCLSPEMIRHNNLSSVPELNADGKTKGYFGKNGRVRAQNFRGERSYGFWVELDSLAWTEDKSSGVRGWPLDDMKEGTTFTEINGHEVCKKYVSPATLRQMRHRERSKKRRTFEMLKQHQDTKQLRYSLDKIPSGAIIYLSEKCHGTSGRTGHVLAPVVKGWRGLWNRLLKSERFKEWMVVSGSRRVNIDPDATEESGFYQGKTFRVDINNRIAALGIPKGMTLFYEIVGYDETGGAIMHAPSTGKISDKKLRRAIKAQYGGTMRYSYGCNPEDPDTEKRYRVLVYRITMTNVDGVSEDLPWVRCQRICNDLGLEMVRTHKVRYGHKKTVMTDNFRPELLKRVERFLDHPSLHDPTHICEGVVVRVESGDGADFYKDKGYLFKVLEGIVKDSGAADLEEAS